MASLHIDIDWLRALAFVVKPLLTVLVWYIVDQLLWKFYRRSTFIDYFFTRHIHSPSNRHSAEQRVKTFKGIFLQTIRVLNGLFFFFILLGNFRIDPKPLIAGIGVVGLGLSLAAQNVLRDFINGLFIIMEDQFNVGDNITIGTFTGAVEHFTMRATRLRASDGKLITIPNGTISQVVNNTKGYSMAIVPVGVAYNSDIPHVLEVMNRCGKIVRERYPDIVQEEPTAQGIIDFRDNDILLRILAKVDAGEQWAVERALRMAIKEEFEKENIEIPFPQRVCRTE